MRAFCKSFSHLVFAAVVAALASSGSASAVEVTINSATMTNGFMNVFELDNTFVFPSGWGVADLSATFPDSTTVNFKPCFVNDTSSFWYTPSGEPGAAGNKNMEANLYAQETDTLSGQTVDFKGVVSDFTLLSGWTFKAFVRDFAPDYSSFNESVFPITGTGEFSVSLATIPLPGRHVQYGLQMYGPNVWVTDVASKGSVTVTAVPEPSTLAILAAGLALVPAARKRLARRRA